MIRMQGRNPETLRSNTPESATTPLEEKIVTREGVGLLTQQIVGLVTSRAESLAKLLGNSPGDYERTNEAVLQRAESLQLPSAIESIQNPTNRRAAAVRLILKNLKHAFLAGISKEEARLNVQTAFITRMALENEDRAKFSLNEGQKEYKRPLFFPAIGSLEFRAHQVINDIGDIDHIRNEFESSIGRIDVSQLPSDLQLFERLQWDRLESGEISDIDIDIEPIEELE